MCSLLYWIVVGAFLIVMASAAKFWANYWFDVAPSEHIKYVRNQLTSKYMFNRFDGIVAAWRDYIQWRYT